MLSMRRLTFLPWTSTGSTWAASSTSGRLPARMSSGSTVSLQSIANLLSLYIVKYSEWIISDPTFEYPDSSSGINSKGYRKIIWCTKNKFATWILQNVGTDSFICLRESDPNPVSEKNLLSGSDPKSSGCGWIPNPQYCFVWNWTR
jgi:hypothetical protein